jgi:hypothetical protein
VLCRANPRLRLSWSDTAVAAAFARILPRALRVPSDRDTGHAAALPLPLAPVAARWRQPKPPGRPPVPDELVALILRLARENTRWGVVTIHGGPRRPGHRMAASAIRKILVRAASRRHPGTTDPGVASCAPAPPVSLPPASSTSAADSRSAAARRVSSSRSASGCAPLPVVPAPPSGHCLENSSEDTPCSGVITFSDVTWGVHYPA